MYGICVTTARIQSFKVWPIGVAYRLMRTHLSEYKTGFQSIDFCPANSQCAWEAIFSGQMDKVINSRFANNPVYSHRHVWGASIPSTPVFLSLAHEGMDC